MEHGKNAQQRESEEFEQFDRHDTIQEAYAEHGKPVVRATSYGVELFASGILCCMASIHTTIIDLVTVFRACDGIVVSLGVDRGGPQEPIFFIIVNIYCIGFIGGEMLMQML
jgi:hypothetical protein